MATQPIVSLADILRAEDAALTEHRTEFADEIALADVVLRAAQEVFRQMSWDGTTEHKVVAGLLAASIRYYAAACTTALRGHVGEGLGLMRCALEAGAYGLLCHGNREKALTWLSADWKTRRKVLGSDTQVVTGQLQDEDAYSGLSEHGLHARIGMSGRGTDFSNPAAWRFYFGDLATNEGRYMLLYTVLLMKDLVGKSYLPTFWPDGAPQPLLDLVHEATERHSVLAAAQHADFKAWQRSIDERMAVAGGTEP